MLQRQTLTSQTINYVLDLIKSRTVKPGEQLPTEKQLTQALGVSRSCVREAMKSLESLGLVRIRPRIGATVLEPSTTALHSAEQFSISLLTLGTDVLLEFRKILEVGVASLAAERADDNDLSSLRLLLDTYEQRLHENQVDCLADLSFHAALATATKNHIVINAWQMTSSRLKDVYDHTKVVANVGEITTRDHRKILVAIQERNPAKARAVMRAHLENAERVWRIALASSSAVRNASPTSLETLRMSR